MTRHATAIATLTLAMLATPATAGVFDVKGTDVSKGETEIAVNSAFFAGYPINADLVRTSAEIGMSYGFSDWWKAGLKIAFDKPVGGDMEATAFGIEGQFLLRKGEGRAPSIAWFLGVDKMLLSDSTNVFTFGPLWQWSLDDKTSFTANTLFQRTFGDNHEKGVDFAYAWQLKREVREGFSIGAEGYGLLPKIGDMPGTSFQEHRIGPVLYFERSLSRSSGAAQPLRMNINDGAKAADGNGKDDNGPKLNIEAGVLFGLTAGTQDRVFKLKGAVTF